jgi:flagellar FliL protein
MSDAQDAAPKPKRDMGKLLGFAFAGLNILGLGAGVYMVFINTLGYTPPSQKDADLQREVASFEEKLKEGPVTYTLDPFNTNLSGVPRRLIRVEMNLEMLDEEGFEEVIKLGAGARDGIVRILNGKSFDELESVQGKLELKNQIITQINGYLDKGVVKNVYFSDFVVQ